MSSLGTMASPALFMSAKEVATICCDKVIPQLIRDAKQMSKVKSDSKPNARGIQDISNDEIERIRLSLITNDMDSYTLYSINFESFKKMLNLDSKFIPNVPLHLFRAFTRRVSLNWYNIIEAAKHENIEISHILESEVKKQQNSTLSRFSASLLSLMTADAKLSEVAGISYAVPL